MWFWALVELANGGHVLFTIERAGNFPGVLTAPLLLVAVARLAYVLARRN